MCTPGHRVGEWNPARSKRTPSRPENDGSAPRSRPSASAAGNEASASCKRVSTHAPRLIVLHRFVRTAARTRYVTYETAVARHRTLPRGAALRPTRGIVGTPRGRDRSPKLFRTPSVSTGPKIPIRTRPACAHTTSRCLSFGNFFLLASSRVRAFRPDGIRARPAVTENEGTKHAPRTTRLPRDRGYTWRE